MRNPGLTLSATTARCAGFPLATARLDRRQGRKTALEVGATYIIYEEDVSQIEIGQAIRDSRAFLKKLGV